jgi:hypothetical protein
MENYIVKKMLKNSLLLKNIKTEEEVFIHRNVFNALEANPELPVFKVKREFLGQVSYWLAIPKTF